jgi:hypothetical protein
MTVKPKSTFKESSYLDLRVKKKFAPNVDLNTATEEMNRLGWVKRKLKKSKIVKKCLFRCANIQLIISVVKFRNEIPLDSAFDSKVRPIFKCK